MTWTLVFRHDKNGTPTHGTEAGLIAKIKAGGSVKIHVLSENNPDKTDYLHAFEPSSVFVQRGHVFAQLTMTGSQQKPEDNSIMELVSPAFMIVQNYGTTGKIFSKTINSETRVQENTTFNWALAWFMDN